MEWRTLLSNLVDNALNYTPAGGRVDVQVSRLKHEAVLTVSDTGPGIPVAERERVFDRFYRGTDATVPGSGLGLAIVKRIADRHRARIHLDDVEAGQGLRVTVTLPEAPSAGRLAMRKLPMPKSGIKTQKPEGFIMAFCK
ncbi:MAG: sensor histidine kinase [Candidatus Competibacteraceae bacterium]